MQGTRLLFESLDRMELAANPSPGNDHRLRVRRRSSTYSLAERRVPNPGSFRKVWKLMTSWWIGMIQPRESGIEMSGNVWLHCKGSIQKEVRRPERSKERSAFFSPARMVNSPQAAPERSF